ncbi:MAG: hypothetical protein JSU08_20425 [Acidobacteria bacterium]|nr:hypothetical protein [Acidobacteriota bacterium]
MTQLKMLSAADTLAEIRRLYFNTSRQTIQQDMDRALDLLKAMASEEDRERATVYMEGLAEMRRDWLKGEARPRGRAPKGPGAGAGGPKPAADRSGRGGSPRQAGQNGPGDASRPGPQKTGKPAPPARTKPRP